jgi:hypothetical protein
MHEWLSPPAEPLTWPELPERVSGDPGQPADDPAGRVAAIAEVIAVAGDTRRLSYVCAGLLAAVLVGIAVVGSALAVSGRALALGSVVLLLPVLASWLATALLVLLSEGPVSRALGQLRHVTGAPVDLTAPWTPVGVDPLPDAEVSWYHLVSLIGAATRQHTRARVALSAALLTTVAFLAWMALSLAAIALT